MFARLSPFGVFARIGICLLVCGAFSAKADRRADERRTRTTNALEACEAGRWDTAVTLAAADADFVRDGGKPVTGLTQLDFRLDDNGVRQHLVSATMVEDVPVDVTLLIDVSGSTARAIAGYRADVRKIADALRPEDTIRVLTFDTYLHDVVPRQSPGTPPPVDRIETGSFTAVNDALAAALLLPVPVGRRHLIYALTDGLDNSSVLGPEDVVAAAAHSDAILFVGATATSAFVAEVLHLTPSPLKEAAEATGGRCGPSEALAAEFLRTYQEFRSRYVLVYDLEGTPPAGWHAVSVGIDRKGKFTIVSKRGYFGSPD